MQKRLPFVTAICLCAGIVILVAVVYPQQRGFRDRLLDFIDSNETHLPSEVIILDEVPEGHGELPSDADLFPFTYRRGDWDRFVIQPEYRIDEEGKSSLVIYRDDDLKIHSYGSVNVDLTYGKSMYTSDRYKQYADDEAVSKVIKSGFNAKQEMQVHIEGSVGKRLSVYVDHDSRKSNNRYHMKYRALGSEEVIQEINAGEIDIKFDRSKYATYDNASVKGMGVDMTMKKGGLQIKAFGSVMKGESDVKYFRGNSTAGNMKLSEYQYLKRTYYQIEPLIRYNNTIVPPYPPNYALQSVNLNSSGFELWIDDQNSLNNVNAIQLPLDGGYYTRMQAGTDYSINFSTGVIRFLREIPASSRIFAVYTLLSGSSTDPYALQPSDPNHPGGIFAGKIFVFIKYGYFIAEEVGDDRNHDGMVNQDIYEIRSFYYIGDKNLMNSNFIMQYYNESRLLSATEIKSLGSRSVDYSEGIIRFIYREPFRELCDAAGTTSRIYTETQSERVYDYSKFRMGIDYYREARSFQLGRMNVIADSVKVKVNERQISKSLYTVDSTSGYLTFSNPSNPLIGPETIIEVRFEYLPSGGQSGAFIGGIRTDYSISDALKVGGSFIYSRSTSSETIPVAGNAPTQTVVMEGDAALALSGKRIAQFLNLFRSEKLDSVPVEFNAYGEYARSVKTVNTFGKLLIENMEAVNDTLYASMQERDWVMASRPPSVPALSNRARLNYYFYRELSSPETLKGIGYAAGKISYAVKPGPFNVAYGHLPSSVQTPLSMVLDFDGTGEYVAVATRAIPNAPVDLSSLQYVEITYQYVGSTDVVLNLELGTINEDADEDGILDTEDANRNTVLDSDMSIGYTEDSGYDFDDSTYPTRVGSGVMLNQQTIGDGVLNSEDLNWNGTLDTSDSTVLMPSLDVSASAGGWQTSRIYIDQSTLTQAQIDILSSVRTARLSITKGAAVSGRIYIDGIRFVSTRWSNVKLDGLPAGPDRLKVAVLDTLSDQEYYGESFVALNRELYQSLYGHKQSSELLTEQESALELTYAVGGGNNVSVTRKFQQPIDIRFYKTMNLWMNFRSFVSGDTVGVVFGSSENDYIEYRVPMDYTKVWREVQLRLNGGSGGEFNPAEIAGTPDLKRISFIKLVVYAPGNSGRLWVDDIYMSEPVRMVGNARWVEGELKINAPLYTTAAGTPLFSDITVKYVNKGHSADFTTIGQTWNELGENSQEVFSSMKILPNWFTSVDYIRQDTTTEGENELVQEQLRGDTLTNSVNLVSDYESDINGVPSMKITYKYDDYHNQRDETISTYDVTRTTQKYTHTPVINIIEKIDKVLGGQIVARMVMNMLFKEYEINRASSELSFENLSNYATIYEREKRQRTDTVVDMQYTSPFLYVKPAMNIGTEEIVASVGQQASSSAIANDMVSDYHIPFIYNKDMKFVERNKRLVLAVGVPKSRVLAPEYKMEVQYYENNFNDISESEMVDLEYRRTRNAKSNVSSSISIPMSFSKIEKLKFIRSANITYGRIAYLYETDIPYEGESTGSFSEKYGISRSLASMSDAGLNLFRYYPFYFFFGRGNFANGRDYVYRHLNMQIVYRDGTVVGDYDNLMRLIDNFSFNTTMDFDVFTLDSHVIVNQTVERKNVLGLPAQVVTESANLNLAIDLMKLFSFSFFRPNRPGLPYHSSTLVIGYEFNNNMIITSNIEEYVHTPSFELNFRRNRMALSLRFGMGIRRKHTKPFILLYSLNRSYRDTVFAENISYTQYYREDDNTYSFTALFETDIAWLYNLLSPYYELVAFPIFTIEYTMAMNRYNYLATTSPEPYDLHLFKTKLAMDLHRNLKGSFNLRMALEQYRNRYTGGISREIFSFDVGMSFSLIF
ncbi:MAG: hypothetical protein JXA20_15275 [Spirochaetes bacterium]|nr:hypothetical protein [Spirochaetota bacterium]